MGGAPVLELHLERFRCFQAVTLQPGPGINLFTGANASGKTSILEALFVLGRGSSFRAARPDAAIQFGADGFVVFAHLVPGPPSRVGVSVGRGEGLSVRLDGRDGTRADLIRAVPIQILDPSCHDLIRGPPAARRQFLDWCVFHVEHDFWEAWQRYRRALLQRNTALRAGDAQAAWAYDEGMLQSGLVVHRCRTAALERLLLHAGDFAGHLLDAELEVAYASGWRDETQFADALLESRQRDLQQGTTTVGPHRADLRIVLRARRARDTVSRGQEKLIAAALILGEVQLVADVRGAPAVLVVDEPGADLDRIHRQRLQHAVSRVSAQVFVTALDGDQFPADSSARKFHVEHGAVQALL